MKTARKEIEDLKVKLQKKEEDIINLKLDHEKLKQEFEESIKNSEKKIEECQKNKKKILELETNLMKSKVEVHNNTSALASTYKGKATKFYYKKRNNFKIRYRNFFQGWHVSINLFKTV